MIASYYRSRILAARQPTTRAPHHVIQATMSEGLAQGPHTVAQNGIFSNQRPFAPKDSNTTTLPQMY